MRLSMVQSKQIKTYIYIGVNSKIGIALGSAESSIQTAGLETTTPSALGVHLGMDSLTGSAGVSVVATNISRNSYFDFAYPGVQGKGKNLYNNTSNSMLL